MNDEPRSRSRDPELDSSGVYLDLSLDDLNYGHLARPSRPNEARLRLRIIIVALILATLALIALLTIPTDRL